jgi:hypothetical protein
MPSILNAYYSVFEAVPIYRKAALINLHHLVVAALKKVDSDMEPKASPQPPKLPESPPPPYALWYQRIKPKLEQYENWYAHAEPVLAKIALMSPSATDKDGSVTCVFCNAWLSKGDTHSTECPWWQLKAVLITMPPPIKESLGS